MMLDRVLIDAYRAEMDRNGLPLDPDLIRSSESDEDGGYRVTDAFLKLSERPTAILFPHYRTVAGAYSRLAEEGPRPGGDMAIISCSADTPMAQFLNPALTRFRLDFLELGGRLAEALLTVTPGFARDYRDRPGGFIQPWEIIPRESDAPVRR